MRNKRVEFQPPAGAVPEGLTTGEEFDLVCTFRIKDGGAVCLTVLGDSKMPGYDEKGGDNKPSYADEAKKLQQASYEMEGQ